MTEEELKPLELVSNVIELKPDKKYLLLFKNDISNDALVRIDRILRERGFDCLCLATRDGDDVQVIEAPTKTEPEPELDPWTYASQVMASKERRAVFAKLSEVLEVPVDSEGNAGVDGEKHRWSFEDAKAFVKPHWEVPPLW